MVHVPNYFRNCKIEHPDKYIKYKKVMFPGYDSTIPAHYIHHIDRVNEEDQKSEEKFWTFKKKIFEVTEAEIQELKDKEINISPNDYEWIIDCFEKTTINKESIGVDNCIKSFISRVPEDVV